VDPGGHPDRGIDRPARQWLGRPWWRLLRRRLRLPLTPPTGTRRPAVRLGLDATPLLGPRTGVGQYVAGLLEGLSELTAGPEVPAGAPEETVLAAVTWRGRFPLQEFRRPAVRVSGRRVPARALHASWARVDWPPVEWLTGPVDVFHATNFVLPPTRRAAGVVTVHDLAFVDHPETVTAASLRYRQLVPRSLARAGAVCVPTRVVAEAVERRYDIAEDRVVITPNGLSRRWLDAPRPATGGWLAGRGLPGRYVLFVGAAEPRKNLPVLLAAHAELPAAPPLLLVGPAGWGPALETADPRRVHRTGYLPNEELVGVVAAATCLVLPSRDEGFGIPALEALACGVPVVCSDLPVLREVCGSTARYVPAGDVGALATALAETLAEDPTAGAAERRARAARFTWRACAEAASSAYARALAG
jgi:glycosyltransferase involved in cell wall biosynthesis